MRWDKKGLILAPSGEFNWMRSHAQVPTPWVLSDCVRVFFATRPEPTVSLLAYVDLDRSDLRSIKAFSSEPVLSLGKPGCFDEHGVMPGSLISDEGLLYLYYTGWQRGTNVPYHNAIGIAVSEDGGVVFRRLFEGPVVDRTRNEPYSAMSPYVLRLENEWHMWYGSGIDWLPGVDRYEPIYIIKYATSSDGTSWRQDNIPCFPGTSKQEASTRPTVVRSEGLYHMWFAYRGPFGYRGKGPESYRIGYACSKDLVHWQRDDDQAGIDVSDHGWDSEMIAYPQVLEIDGRILMFYNGSGFGASGFGYAELVPG